jgi:hypothetical protein
MSSPLLITEVFLAWFLLGGRDCPLSVSTVPSGIDARDLERVDQEGKDGVGGVMREASLPREEVSLGKTRRAMILMEGAQATRMATWFSMTEQSIVVAKRTAWLLVGMSEGEVCSAWEEAREHLHVKSGFVAPMWIVHTRAPLAAKTLPPASVSVVLPDKQEKYIQST